jgi:cobalt-zinc-cadmium efflux system outer membrane protein
MPLMVIVGLAIMRSVTTAQNPSPQAPIPQPSMDIRMPNAPIPATSSQAIQNGQENPEAIPNGSLARITLADLEQIAMANNPTLAQAAMRVRALQGKQIQAGLYPNPVIGYIGDEMGNEGTAGQQGGFLRQELVTNGKRDLSQAVAGHEANQAEYALKSQRLRVINDVRTSGYEVIAAQRLIALDEQLVRIGEECMKTAEHLLAAKEVGRVDILQSRVETNSAKLQLDNARNRHLAAWRKLAVVVGMPNLEPRPMADELEIRPAELPWNDTLTKILTESPELAQARAGVERARCALAREQAERIPKCRFRCRCSL